MAGGVREAARADDQRGEADRQVDREQPRPIAEAEDRRGQRRPDGGRSRDHQRVVADAAPQHRRWISGADQRRIDAEHRGGADALEHPRRDQLWQSVRQRAQPRAQREQRQPGQVHAGVADAITQRGERQQEHGDRQLIGIDDPHRLRRLGMEPGGDGRQRDIGDGAVEHRHRDRQPDRHDRPIAPRHRQAVGFGHGPDDGLGIGRSGWRGS